jgi:hypothetical protein
VHEPHEHSRTSDDPTTCRFEKGEPEGQVVEPAVTMHAEKPEGGAPVQTASEPADGTAQRAPWVSLTRLVVGTGVAVQEPVMGGSGVARI